MTSLFEEDTSASLSEALVSSLIDAYREKLRLNPPTPGFNVQQNGERAEAYCRIAAKKDITRILAVLDEKGLTITEKTK